MPNQINTKALAMDAFNGVSSVGNFSAAEIDNQIREVVKAACGGEWYFYSFKANEYKVFAVLAELLPVSINASLGATFDRFAEIKDDALGDMTSFHVEDNRLFPVATCANGTQNIERRTITNSVFTVPTSQKGIKIYAELDAMMSGRISFANMVARVGASFANEIGYMISNAIYGSYSSVGTEFKATGAFDEDTLDDIIANVMSATGAQRVNIFGDVKALKQLANIFGYSDTAKDQANALGFYGNYGTAECIALPNAYIAGTNTFAVNRNHIIVIPADEKIVKVVMEGQPIITQTDYSNRQDLQTEYTFIRKMGAAAMTTINGGFGFYKFS